jgi:type IV secretion system protein VirB5
MKRLIRVTVAALALSSGSAFAQGIPVIDAAALAQMLQQVITMSQQLEQMKNQFSLMTQQYAAITGNAGLGGIADPGLAARNYLPSDFTSLLTSISNGSGGSLSALAQQIRGSNATMTDAQMGAIMGTGTAYARLMTQRDQNASTAAAVQTAFSQASARFATLQSLISSVNSTTDQTSKLDLQNRIQSEQAQLANEKIKLDAMSASLNSQQQLNAQQSREAALQFINTQPPNF